MFSSLKRILDGITARLGGERSLENISRSSDIVLALFVIMIIGMIIIPLNPHIIDYLIAINLTVSVSLLMVALYIPSRRATVDLPFSVADHNLYRLGINIASTRQILLHAYAGDIIFNSSVTSSSEVTSSSVV